MSRLQSAARHEAPSTHISPPHRRARPPTVEAIAGWSARHRRTAVFGWLALVVVAYIIGQLLGTPARRPVLVPAPLADLAARPVFPYPCLAFLSLPEQAPCGTP